MQSLIDNMSRLILDVFCHYELQTYWFSSLQNGETMTNNVVFDSLLPYCIREKIFGLIK